MTQKMEFGLGGLEKTMSRALTAAKASHTQWEASFKGDVPEHDWEDWYARFIVKWLEERTMPPSVVSSLLLDALTGPEGRLHDDAQHARTQPYMGRDREDRETERSQRDATTSHWSAGKTYTGRSADEPGNKGPNWS